MKIQETSFPALYRLANDASVDGQRRYLSLLRLNLVLLVLGAALASVEVHHDLVLRVFRISSAAVLAGGILLTLLIQHRNHEEVWYGGRAAAESVKSLTWRYMAGADPFPREAEARVADERFLADIRAVRSQRQQLSLSGSAGELGGGPLITEDMISVRALPLSERKQIYARDRIEGQRMWYAEKSAVNGREERKFFRLALAVQGCAVFAAILLVAYPSFPINAPGILTSGAAGLISWMQAKRYQELSQSYDVTALELAIVGEQLRHVSGEEDFARFVADAESAISREHTLWVARRDRFPRPML